LRIYGNKLASPVTAEAKYRDNPHAPLIHPEHQGVRDAVVFLDGVDLELARPVTHPPLRLVQDERRLFIEQGAVRSRVGFAAQGDMVEIESREPVFHCLRATGAAYFSLTFAEPGVRRRSLPEVGKVEWISGANYYWMRAHVFVADHPYFSRTNEEGCFQLDGVPPGTYQLRCWHPNWKREYLEYDHQTGLVSHLHFADPAELTVPIVVSTGGVQTHDFRLSLASFPVPMPRH
jgi:hypothetical protein